MTDYSVYRLSNKEKKQYYIASCLVLAAIGVLFYRSIIAAALCCIASRPLEKYYALMMAGRRREKLLEGFRDVLYCISSSVAAGRQMPYALQEAEKEMAVSYGAEADITAELHRINGVYRDAHGDPAELLTDFAERSHLEEIKQFAKSYTICRRSGGNLEDVCLKSCNLLLDKISFKNEVKSLIAQKKLDIGMLVSLPVIILVFLNLVSYEYISILYTTAAGRAIMTLCILAIGGALYWSLKITDIKL